MKFGLLTRSRKSRSWAAYSLLLVLMFVSTGSKANDSVLPQKITFSLLHSEEFPFHYYDEKNAKYQGIYPALLGLLAERLSLKIEIKPISRNRLDLDVIQGTSDATWQTKHWSSQSGNLLFSNVVFSFNEFFYSLNKLDENETIEDWIRGKDICLRKDYIYPALEKYFANKFANKVPVSFNVPLVNMLLNKRCDLMLTDEFIGAWAMAADQGHLIHQSPKPLEIVEMTLAFNQSWAPYLAKINQQISLMIKDGSVAKVIDNSSKAMAQ